MNDRKSAQCTKAVISLYSLLYVDDEPDLLNIGRLFLEQGGQFSVDTVSSAHAALGLLRSKRYDAIISDYQMPGMDGIALLKKVRTSGNTIPFILFSGRGREEVVIQALNEGADFYLQKGGDPVSQFAELAHKIRQAIQKRQAESRIRDHERREADLINFLPDATFAIDTSGVVIAWNRALEEMTGIPAREMLGKGNYEYAIPFYGERRPILADLVFASGETLAAGYYTVIRKEGDLLIAETDLTRLRGKPAVLWGKACPLYDNSGKIAGAIQSLRDITERRQAEEALRESENKYRTVFENTGTATVILEEDCRISLANNEFVQLSGFSREAIEGKKTWTEFVAEEHRECMLARHRLRRQDRHTALTHYEFRFVTGAGDTRTIFLSVDIIPGTKKSIASLQDITGRKKTEAALQESERRYRNLYQYAQVGLFETSVKDGTILACNERFAAYAGYSSTEDAIGTAITSMYADPGDRRDVVRTLEEKGHVEDYVARFRNVRTGRRFWVQFSARLDRKKGVLEGSVRDITRYKETAEALRESENLFRTLVESLLDPILILSFEGLILFANPAAFHLIGHPETRITGTQSIARFLDTGTMEQALSDLQALRETGGPVISEYRITTLRGEGRWIEAFGIRISYRGAGADLVTLRDITGRKQAEEALRESQENYRIVLNNIPDLVLVHRDGIILYVNPAMIETLEVRPEEVLGRPLLFDFIAPGDHARVTAAIRRRMETGRDEPYEIELRSRNGGRRTVIVRGTRIEYDRSPATLCVLTDITERKRTIEALRKSEEKFRTFVENANDIIYTLTLDGIFSYVSPKFSEVLGYENGEIIGKPFENIVHPDDLPACHEFVRLTFVAGERMSGLEYRVRHKNGTWQWHTTTASPVRNKAGTIVAFIGICHDITERKLADETLRQANRKLRLLSGITRHDINNQLAIMRGHLALLDGESSGARSAWHLDTVNASAQYIASMIQFTGEYEEIGVNAPAWQDCHALIDTAAKQVQCGNVLVKNDLLPGTELFADPLVVKVFTNLMDNAARHGGKITTIRFYEQESGEDLRIVCEDDGGGIPAEEKEQVFERGFGKNTGLGLFLVREILSITGIAIRETGEPGKGARFIMTVPKGTYRTEGNAK